jgi:hypothetical protein
MPPAPEPFVCVLPGPEASRHITFLVGSAFRTTDGAWCLPILWQRLSLLARFVYGSWSPEQLVDVPVGITGPDGKAVDLTKN